MITTAVPVAIGFAVGHQIRLAKDRQEKDKNGVGFPPAACPVDAVVRGLKQAATTVADCFSKSGY